jgi:hypothetical protein
MEESVVDVRPEFIHQVGPGFAKQIESHTVPIAPMPWLSPDAYADGNISARIEAGDVSCARAGGRLRPQLSF